MKKYERIREIFNNCDRNQMRDVDIQIIESDDIDAAVKEYCQGGQVSCERSLKPDGTVIFDINIDGLLQRVSYIEIIE